MFITVDSNSGHFLFINRVEIHMILDIKDQCHHRKTSIFHYSTIHHLGTSQVGFLLMNTCMTLVISFPSNHEPTKDVQRRLQPPQPDKVSNLALHMPVNNTVTRI